VASGTGGTSTFWGGLTVENSKPTSLTGSLGVNGDVTVSKDYPTLILKRSTSTSPGQAINFTNSANTLQWQMSSNISTGVGFEINEGYTNRMYIAPGGAVTFTSSVAAQTGKFTDLSPGYLPYHVSDASGLANSPVMTDGTNVTVGGNITATNFILTPSDKRLKENIKAIPNLKRFDGLSYYQANYHKDTGKLKHNVALAQEVEMVAPELVITGEDGMKSVAYIELLVAEVVRLKERVKEIENKECSEAEWYDQYLKYCYNDSTLVTYTKAPDFSPYTSKKTGTVQAIYLSPIEITEWKHREPTFTGYIEWRKKINTRR
jgi:hypothetical protein